MVDLDPCGYRGLKVILRTLIGPRPLERRPIGMCIILLAFFAPTQKLGLGLDRESRMNAIINLRYARFTQGGKSRPPHGTIDGCEEATRGKPEDGACSTKFSHIRLNLLTSASDNSVRLP